MKCEPYYLDKTCTEEAVWTDGALLLCTKHKEQYSIVSSEFYPVEIIEKPEVGVVTIAPKPGHIPKQ